MTLQSHSSSLSGTSSDLSRLAAEAERHHGDSLSPRTRKAYESDWRQWDAWCARLGTDSLPVRPEIVRLYVTDMAAQVTTSGDYRFKAATITRHLAALAWRSRQEGGIHDLARHPAIAPVMAGIRRERAEKPRRVKPLLRDDVARLISSMSHDTWPAGVSAARDTLALLLGFAAALRREEVAGLRIGDLLPDPHDGLHLHLGATKTDQDGTGTVLAVPYGTHPITCAPCARVRWLRLVATSSRPERMRLVLTTGDPDTWEHVCRGAVGTLDTQPEQPLLRAIPRSGAIGDDAITGGALNQMLKRRLAAAGYNPEPYGSHSLRAGFVTQARRNGAPARAVRRQTRHASDAMVDVYDREYVPLLGNAVEDVGL